MSGINDPRRVLRIDDVEPDGATGRLFGVGPMTSEDPKTRQGRFNAASFDQWDGFAGHRRRVSDLLSAGSGRLIVLGAGNANDLDLVTLLGAHREVHLVDLDADALVRGVERQGVTGRPGLVLHGALDVTGMLEAMTRWSPHAEVSGAELTALMEWPTHRVALVLPGPFDVVASTCLLSQLIANVHDTLGEAHPQLGRAIQAIRLGHLRLLASLARPGGRVVLITDLASSNWVPELKDLTGQVAPSSIRRIARDHGLIRGVDPAELIHLVRQDCQLSRRSAETRLVGPWTWRLHVRTYLVCAIEVRFTSLSHRSGPAIR
jgi:hypothetical protein